MFRIIILFMFLNFFLFVLSFANDLDFNNFIVEEVSSILPEQIPFFVIIGLLLRGIAVFIFNVNLPTIPSLVVSIVIGPAGIGTMLLLHAFGLLAI
jgi:hypothetical protein